MAHGDEDGPPRWSVHSDSGWFAADAGGRPLLHGRVGTEVVGIDQLAPVYNRPDLLMSEIGLGSPEARAHFRAVHENRLRKSGMVGLAEAIELPSAKIVDVDTADGIARLTVEFRAANGLSSYTLWVDGVPVEERAVQGTVVRTAVETATTSGENRLEVSSTDRKGTESARALRIVEDKTREVTPKLFFVGFGVSEYQDPAIPDLAYAHQDARDLFETLQARSAWDVQGRVYVNDEVDARALRDASRMLAAARPEDVVVVFIAGHGKRGPDHEFYLLTSETKVDDMKGTAMPLSSIEGLFSATRARTRLFLVDACESGEEGCVRIDAATEEKLAKRGLVPRAFEAAPLASKPSTFACGLRRDRMIYRDFRRRTGATVIASSAADQASLEKAAWANGAFTEALVEVLRAPGAASIDARTLKEKVAERVLDLTSGLQHPAMDVVNPHRRLRLQLRPRKKAGR